MNRLLAALLGAVFLGMAGVAAAGPIIIAGTDADDHGFVSGGANFNGWKFMQSALENLLPQVGNGQKTAVCIGCNSSSALNAFNSAYGLATKPVGWTSVVLTSSTDITGFFNGSGTTNVNNAGLIYMPTDAGNVGGGITAAQVAIVNSNASILNSFVAGGGGLFTQSQNYVTGGFGWLTTLLPGLNVHGDNDGTISNSNSLTITAAGNAAFPGLTNSDVSNATPWHNWFDGSLGGLSVLVTGPARGPNRQVINGAVVLGGGGGTVIVCGQPGQPPCPTPEPETLPLLGLGLLGLVVALRRKLK